MTCKATLYKTPSLKQKIAFQGQLIGCTDTCAAMAFNAQALGGLSITEYIVRRLSGELVPDPASPGLNQAQLVRVSKQLHLPYSSGVGGSFETMLTRLTAGRRIVAQLWYADIGGTNIGHAIFLESRAKRSDGRWYLGGVDPMKGRRDWFLESAVREGMERLGRMNGLANGGTFHGYTRVVPMVAK